jgi:hypothetical protein
MVLPSKNFSLLMVTVLAALTAVECKSKDRQSTNESQHESLESVGKEVALTFPSNARLIGVHRERGVDDLIAVKVEMDAADWPGFLGRAPVDATLIRPGERGLLGPDEEFWDPHQAKNLHTVEALLPNQRVLNLGYDDSRIGMMVVYVVNHGR